MKSKMKMDEALDMVHKLATIIAARPDIKIPFTNAQVNSCLDMVEEYIEGMNRNVLCNLNPDEAYTELCEALEERGDQLGTESQLDKTRDFLDLAFEVLKTNKCAGDFLRREEVQDFVEEFQAD